MSRKGRRVRMGNRKSRTTHKSTRRKSASSPRNKNRRPFRFSEAKGKVKTYRGRKKDRSLKKRKKDAEKKLRNRGKKATPRQKRKKGIEYHGPRLRKGVRPGRRTVYGNVYTITAIGQHGGYENRVIKIRLYRYFKKRGKISPVTPRMAQETARETIARLRRQYRGSLKILRIDVRFLDRKGYVARKGA